METCPRFDFHHRAYGNLVLKQFRQKPVLGSIFIVEQVGTFSQKLLTYTKFDYYRRGANSFLTQVTPSMLVWAVMNGRQLPDL